jgi:Flp pilus assembly CpaF family ATPase
LNTSKEWFENIYQHMFLKGFITRKNLQEIIIHSNQKVQIDTDERIFDKLNNISQEDLQSSLEILAQKNGQEWNNSKPFVSFQTELFNTTFRVSLCHFSTNAKKQSKVFFRKITSDSFCLKSFHNSDELNQFLHKSILNNFNIAVCGATGSGKTSFLRSLINLIPPHEHIITIEDTHELILSREEQTSFISKPTTQNSMKNYCQYSLRMRPDRILVGEIRGNEVVPFLLSGNSGHKGMMTSLHANSAIDCISRLAFLFQIYANQKGLQYEHVLQLVCSSLDTIIFLKNKQVSEIIKIIGCEGTTPYFERIYDTTQ